jgi:hypothetical protein
MEAGADGAAWIGINRRRNFAEGITVTGVASVTAVRSWNGFVVAVQM